ncbi:MAG: ABC transporter substrate-binding protein [Candidatus Binatia bacterium]|nr:ABC transporter substrate-binding protein [Candidatus Binatia bacterium]
MGKAVAAVGIIVLGALLACTNNPYPDADSGRKVLYRTMRKSPPKTLDPAVAYSVVDHIVTGSVYDTLLDYDYLARPYRLIPGLVEKIPVEVANDDGTWSLSFRLRPDLLYSDDECFEAGRPGAPTRNILAADVAFELMRIADPSVGSPVGAVFSRVRGFEDFTARLQALRDADPAFAQRRIDEQYREAGGIDGARVHSDLDLEIVLTESFPQLSYWFAMEFTTPVPWEAVAYYDGEDGRDLFSEHAVSTGPFRLTRYDKRARISLVRNENWYGVRHPEWRAPGAIYPTRGSAEDRARGLLDPRYVGRPLPFLDGVELVFENEQIPGFNKFLQGYYDYSAIIEETFDQVVSEGGLTPSMEAMGVRLSKAPSPSIYYVGFNMDDPVVGRDGDSRSRLLRHAMSLAIDSEEFIRLFFNDRGIPAESPLPPGIFGHEDGLGNPFRRFDLAGAREVLAEAGYPRGLDPETARPLHLVLTTGDTSARSRLRYQFLVDSWRRIGVDVEISSTNYNQFQDVLRRGAYQVFFFGWAADYPDPENFLVQLWGELGKSKSGGSNSANFDNVEYNGLFLEMRNMPDGPERLAVIRRMLEILRVERPWIEIFTPEEYVLSHGWLQNLKSFGMSVPMMQYLDVEEERRAERRVAWNQPVEWPAWVLAALVVAAVVPAVVTFLRERQ